MKGSKEYFLEMQKDLVARCEIPMDVYKELKVEHADDIVFRGWKSDDLTNLYRKDEKWQGANDKLKEAIEVKEEIESEIRVSLMIKSEKQ